MTSAFPLAHYSSYIPAYRIARADIHLAVRPQSSPAPDLGRRSVAGGDEDSTTMAVAAVRALCGGRDTAPWLYLSSSNLAVLDLTNASLVAAASGLSAGVVPVDLGGLRSGVAGIVAAAATGGIAVASDLRTGPPGSAAERDGGDAAAAFNFADTAEPVAELVASATKALPITDYWRQPGGTYSSAWEERFLVDLYTHAATDVVSRLLAGRDQPPTLTVVASPIQRVAHAIVRRFADAPGAAVQIRHAHEVGYCGAAEFGCLLAEALDVARAGDTILAVSLVGGADATLLRVLRDGPRSMVDDRRRDELAIDVPYFRFLTWRGLIYREAAPRPEWTATSLPAAFRSHDWKYALTGGRCGLCGFVQLPRERVCGSCGCVDGAEPYSVADQLGTVVSVSTDLLSDSAVAEPLAGVVDFDGGGRMSVEFTDTEDLDIGSGSRVEMSFRRVSTIKGLPNYFWRARPMRRNEP
jgi:hydroxymethylglutaryl-CoA synthase